ncbi:MAG: SPOR domain-containing protein [Blastocatellia bacterium]
MKHIHILTVLMLLFAVGAVAAASGYTIQTAAAASQTEAEKQVAALKGQGLDAYWIKSRVPGQGEFYRVRIGHFATRAAARTYGENLMKRGIIREYFTTEYIAPVHSQLSAPSAPVAAKSLPQSASAAESSSSVPVTSPAAEREKTAEPAPAPAAPAQVTQAAPVSAVPAEMVLKPTAAVSAPPEAELSVPTGSAAPAAPAESLNAAAPGVREVTLPKGYRRYVDEVAGFFFDHPEKWKGGRWLKSETQMSPSGNRPVLKMDAAANFISENDLAFVNAIWNSQPEASSRKYDNDLLTETILKGMQASPGMRQLTEVSRRTENSGDQIRTWLELRALFGPSETPNPLEFIGQAVIVRGPRGVLVVSVFYAPEGPAENGRIAGQITGSAGFIR